MNSKREPLVLKILTAIICFVRRSASGHDSIFLPLFVWGQLLSLRSLGLQFLFQGWIKSCGLPEAHCCYFRDFPCALKKYGISTIDTSRAPGMLIKLQMVYLCVTSTSINSDDLYINSQTNFDNHYCNCFHSLIGSSENIVSYRAI